MVATAKLSEYQRSRERGFNHIMAAFTPAFTAKVLNKLTPGVSWSGCTKSLMARAFAVGDHGLDLSDVMRLQETALQYLKHAYCNYKG